MLRLPSALVFAALLLAGLAAACTPVSPAVTPGAPTAAVTLAPTQIETVTVEATPTPLPTPAPTLADWLHEQGRFGILLEAIDHAGLTELLAGNEVGTLFAPTDEAFKRLPAETLAQLLDQPDLLKVVLLYHMSPEVVRIEVLAKDAGPQIEAGHTFERVIPTLAAEASASNINLPGHKATVALWRGEARIDYAAIIAADKQVNEQVVQIIDAVLTPLALPGAESKPDNLNAVETWIPYAPGEPLPIGDAELVPGDPLIRAGVEALAEQLKARGTVINIARAVRLGEQGEITHLAPVGPESVPDDFEKLKAMAQQGGYDIGVLVVEGKTDLKGGPGPYIQRLIVDPGATEDLWFVRLVDGRGEVVEQLEVAYDPASFIAAIPTAAIFYGTRWCKDCNNSGCFCHRCGFLEQLLEPDWSTKAACQAS
jgi:uncharacterized surface protein with fasciclin (FAS1) repeats